MVIRVSKPKKDRQHDGQKKKDKQQYTQKTKATRTPLETEVLWKGKQFLFHQWNPSCYSIYTPKGRNPIVFLMYIR